MLYDYIERECIAEYAILPEGQYISSTHRRSPTRLGNETEGDRLHLMESLLSMPSTVILIICRFVEIPVGAFHFMIGPSEFLLDSSVDPSVLFR